MLRPRFLAIVIAALFLNASSFAGTKYAVGTCRPSLPSYTTISQAVSGVPSGSTVLVCPGNYPEQILIAQPLTLEGVQSGGSGAAVVVVPPGGVGAIRRCRILLPDSGANHRPGRHSQPRRGWNRREQSCWDSGGCRRHFLFELFGYCEPCERSKPNRCSFWRPGRWDRGPRRSKASGSRRSDGNDPGQCGARFRWYGNFRGRRNLADREH